MRSVVRVEELVPVLGCREVESIILRMIRLFGGVQRVLDLDAFEDAVEFGLNAKMHPLLDTQQKLITLLVLVHTLDLCNALD